MYRIPKAGMTEQQIFQMKTQQHHCDFMIFRAFGPGQFLTKQDLWHIETSNFQFEVSLYMILSTTEVLWKVPGSESMAELRDILLVKKVTQKWRLNDCECWGHQGGGRFLDDCTKRCNLLVVINSSPGGNKHRSATSADPYSPTKVNGHQA